MTLYVGTSGWAYREWKPGFYPEELPQTRFLEHYARIFGACEINATFYRLQAATTFTRWSAATPESFRFAVKAHRGLTHTRALAPAPGKKRGLLDDFLRSLSTLGPRLGPVLFQFPPTRQRDTAAFQRLLEALPTGTKYAFEFRHESWDTTEIASTIESAGGALCVSETKGDAPATLPPGRFGYVRLRADCYADEERDAWKRLLDEESTRRDVYVFAKHEGVPTGDPYAGVGLAQWLVGDTNEANIRGGPGPALD